MAIAALQDIYLVYQCECQTLADPYLTRNVRYAVIKSCEQTYRLFKTTARSHLSNESPSNPRVCEILTNILADVKLFHAGIKRSKREFLETAVEILYERYRLYDSNCRTLENSYLSLINKCALFEHCERCYHIFKTAAYGMLENEFDSNPRACEVLTNIINDVKTLHARHKQSRLEFLTDFYEENTGVETSAGIKMWLESVCVQKMVLILNAAKMIRQAEKYKFYAPIAGLSQEDVQGIEQTIRTYQLSLSDLRFVFG
jgi:hypothetical protein